MFPSPQDALPLLPRPKVKRYRKLAEELLKSAKAFRRGDSTAIREWAQRWVEVLVAPHIARCHNPGRTIGRWTKQVEGFAIRKLTADDESCRLTQAQFVIARTHGFDSWPRLLKHIKALTNKSSRIARYEAAVEAIISGDLKTLARLLKKDPKLVKLRSTREHRATLLHYVSANGVEGYRQLTPPNAVKIARVLLNAGAEVDAEADVYGGGATTLGLVGTSVHPFRAGVQNPLMQILLDHGAEIDRPNTAGNQQNAVIGCLANGRIEAAKYLAERGAKLDLEAAAGVGRLDVLETFFSRSNRLKKGVTRQALNSAFVNACFYGQNEVVRFLLRKGVKPGVDSGDGQTGPHYAVIGGQLETLELLLKENPPLEKKNIYGGTVLGQTLWSAGHGGDPDLYAEIIETLIAAGAKVSPRHVPVNEKIDALLRRYGSEPEPTWYWFGEGPASESQ
jgi:ankyrin repeat protein